MNLVNLLFVRIVTALYFNLQIEKKLVRYIFFLFFSHSSWVALHK